ncbi:heterokaryon incompatibility protein-domain-containing protein [Truncatella angustata]|uniref:Heterokaryon incompatibility protein-domain-containing protein n=1 Tax=Truncatella angustata TaxID=152316 RepID=A0A9P8RQ22_9PEZI|nr:heterokaryon incompatibility protein-domain-containing protein [Truncatella angustata]KAH6647275.1 heterokaryon incompatibility protein-domain-containing protein [Truncatella angustata]
MLKLYSETGSPEESAMHESVLALPDFQYDCALPSPEDYIRLLEIKEIGFSDTTGISCELTLWPLDPKDRPKYHAISYTWGDPKFTTYLRINGKKFQVRQNCEYALRQAHSHGGSRYYWLDAICIDQNDTTEKGHQVAMMGDIYRNAAHVLACVGPHHSDSLFMIRTLEHYQGILNPILGPVFGGPNKTHHITYEDDPRYRNFHGHRRSLLEWFLKCRTSTWRRNARALLEFLKRPYFSRVWVVQELTLATSASLHCGMDQLSIPTICAMWDVLNGFYSPIRHSSQWLPSPMTDWIPFMTKFSINRNMRYLCHRVWFLRRFWVAETSMKPSPEIIGYERSLQTTTESFTRLTLYDAMKQLEYSQSDDLRDRVYGVLSLVDWTRSPRIFPDYDINEFDLAINVLRLSMGSDTITEDQFMDKSPSVQMADLLVRLLELHFSSRIIQGVIRGRRRSLESQTAQNTNPNHTLEHSAKLVWCGFKMNTAGINMAPFALLEDIDPDGSVAYRYESDSITTGRQHNSFSPEAGQCTVLASHGARRHDWILYPVFELPWLTSEDQRCFIQINFAGPSRQCATGLIARKDKHDRFSLIGQGIIDWGNASQKHFDRLTHGQIHAFQVLFASEDLLLRMATWSSFHYSYPHPNSHRKLSERLEMPVCGSALSSYAIHMPLKQVNTSKALAKSFDSYPGSATFESVGTPDQPRDGDKPASSKYQ